MELIFLFALTFFVALFSFRYFRAKRRLSFIENYQFPEVIRSKLKEQYPSLSDEQVASVLLALKSYFRMSHVGKMNMVAMPSKIVDVAWHEFILFTKSYQQFCSKAFGNFLHHTPTEAMKTKTTAQEGIKRAWKIACSLDQINPKKPNKLPLIFSIDSDLQITNCLLYTSPSPRDLSTSRMPSSA